MANGRLPRFVPPMLAVLGEPFDSDEHLYEIKWDGIRTLAFVERGTARLASRNDQPLSDRYPELAELGALPDGTVLDGEVVALRDGKPDFGRVLRRTRGSGGPRSAARAAADGALTYVAFDILYRDYRSLMDLPLSDRRGHLEELVGPARSPGLALSEGLQGAGTAFYREACERGLEGVVAKRLASTYAPGKRNGAWVKIKRRQRAVCVVIGFIEKAGRDFQSLLVATNQLPGESGPGALRYVGRVGGGFTELMHARVNDLLWARPAPAPVVPCPEKARWIEAGLYCTVSFAELTEAGLLRAPVFEGLVEA
jgi:bifunctional non-homologous end joining protein LigD